MNNELERMWKEAVLYSSKSYPGVCVKSLRVTTEAVGQNRQFTGRDLNSRRRDYEPLYIILLLLPLALQPTVGFGLSNNVLPFFPICHQLSPSSHFQHLKISFYLLFPSFPGSSPSSRPLQFLSEDYLFHSSRF